MKREDDLNLLTKESGLEDAIVEVILGHNREVAVERGRKLLWT